MSRRSRAGALLALLALLVGCGVRPQPQPEPVPADRLPSARSATPGSTVLTGPVRVWSARGRRLVPVTVTLPGPDLPARLQALLELTAAQQQPSAVPPGTRLLSLHADVDLVEVRLSRELEDLPAEDVPLALGQVVLTLTEDASVRRVRVRGETRLLALPGTGASDLVRADFDGIVAGSTGS